MHWLVRPTPVEFQTICRVVSTDARAVRPYIPTSMKLVCPSTRQLPTKLIINGLHLAFQSHPFCTVISVISHGEMTYFAVWYGPYCKPGHSLRSSKNQFRAFKNLPRPSQREGARACGHGECSTASASSLTFSTLFVLPSAACLLQGYKILHPPCKFFGKKMKWYMFLSVCCFGIKLAMLIHTVGFIW